MPYAAAVLSFKFSLIWVIVYLCAKWVKDEQRIQQHLFALPLYWCKWRCKVKGKGKLYTLGQVVGLYTQHWLITDINRLINSSEIVIRSQAFCLCYSKSKESKKAEIRSVCFCASVYKHTKTYPTEEVEGRHKYHRESLLVFLLLSNHKPVIYLPYFGCNQSMCAVQLRHKTSFK